MVYVLGEAAVREPVPADQGMCASEQPAHACQGLIVTATELMLVPT